MLAGVGRLLVGDTPAGCVGDEEFRTGFVVAHRHVLTAAHCVRGLDRALLWLRLPAGQGDSVSGGPYVFVPVRVLDSDDALDGAVLALDITPGRLAAAGWNPSLDAFLDRVAVSVEVEVPVGLAVRTEGFPASGANADGTAFDGVVVDPDSRLQHGALPAVRACQLRLGQLGAAAPESPKGHSGGPVLTHAAGGVDGSVAVGLVRTYPRGDDDGWAALGATVYATRIDDLARRFPAVADAVVHAAQRRMDAVSPPRVVGSGSLVRLLRADAAVVGFRGREQERAALHAWCASQARRAAWLVVGPAGQGKTRLALELARELAETDGWLTGLFRGAGDLGAVRQVLAAGVQASGVTPGMGLPVPAPRASLCPPR